MRTDLDFIKRINLKKYIPKLPARKQIHFTGFCSNCEHPVDGKFCTNCGQSVKDFQRPFFSVLFESVSDALSFDSRLLHTLSPLLLKPGFLTKEFMLGKRAKYTPPFRLYLFLTFFAFFLLSFNHTPDQEFFKEIPLNSESKDKFDFKEFINQMSIDSDLEQDSLNNVKLEINNDVVFSNDSLANEMDSNLDIDMFNNHISNFVEMWKLSPALMMDTALKQLSRTLLMILPLFALFLALIYIRQWRYLLEHLLISLNFHSFIFIVAILSELLLLLNSEICTEFAIYLYLIIPVQLLITLKTYYNQSWFKTVIKFMILSFIYNILLSIGILLGFVAMTQS